MISDTPLSTRPISDAGTAPPAAPAITPSVFPERVMRRVLPVAAACAFALSLPILPNALIPTGMTSHPDRIAAPRRVPVAAVPSFVEPPQVRFGFVQYSDSTFSSSCAFGAANASGNLLIACVLWDNFATNQISKIDDTRGNVWKRATNAYAQDATVGAAGEIWFCESSLAGANTITVTWTGATPGLMGIQVVEYRGQSTVSPFDVGANGVTASGTVATTSSFTTSANSELIVGFSVPAGVATGAGTGYTSRGINAFGDIVEDDLTADPAGARTATANVSAGAAIMVAATFSTWPVGAPFTPLVPLFGDASLPFRARGVSPALREAFGGYPAPISAASFVANVGLTSFPDRLERARPARVGDAEVTPIDRTSPICEALFADFARRARPPVHGMNYEGQVPERIGPAFDPAFPEVARRARPLTHGGSFDGFVPPQAVVPSVFVVFADATRRARAAALGADAEPIVPERTSPIVVSVFPDAMLRARRADGGASSLAFQIAPTIVLAGSPVFPDRIARRPMISSAWASATAPERTAPLASVDFPRSVARRRLAIGDVTSGTPTPPRIFFDPVLAEPVPKRAPLERGSVATVFIVAPPAPPPTELDTVHAYVRPRPIALLTGGVASFVPYPVGGAVISRLAGSVGTVSPTGEVATFGYLSVTIGGVAISGEADGVDLAGELGAVKPRGDISGTNDGGST